LVYDAKRLYGDPLTAQPLTSLEVSANPATVLTRFPSPPVLVSTERRVRTIFHSRLPILAVISVAPAIRRSWGFAKRR